jgi:nucleoside phosphorylase
VSGLRSPWWTAPTGPGAARSACWSRLLVQNLDKGRPRCHDAEVVERRSEIDSREQELLRVLVESNAPVSGRRVANVLGISPTTASKRLKALLDRGLVNAQSAGAAVLWSANEADAGVRALRRQLEATTRAVSGSAPVPPDAVAWRLPLSGVKSTLKVVVLTALAQEYAAVRSHLAEVTQRRTRSGTRYDVGFVRGEHLDWEVHLAEVDMGNSGAAAEVAGAVETFSPQLILFVGVAGGLKPSDQRHGDVVVASMVYNVHSAKIAPHPGGGTQIQSRPLGVRASHRLEQLVKVVSRMAWAADTLPGGQPQGTAPTQPAVHLRPIVAGEMVLADADSDMRKLIAERFNDAAAIDMESYGVYETAHRYDLPVLAVRGLSDLIGDKDPAADRELQPRAAANAAAFAIALLYHAEEDDLPPGSSPGGPSSGGAPSRPSTPQGPDGAGADVPTAEESLTRLAPALRSWWRRLRARRGAVADSAIAELAERSASPVGWLGRIRHRPPVWLREDDHGDAWALVAWFAESHGSPHATWLYDEAAHRAEQIGEDTIAGLHRLQAALAAVRHPAAPEDGLENGATRDGLEVARADALRRLSDQSLLSLGPVTAAVRSAVSDDIDGMLAAAPAALHALGLPSENLIRPDRSNRKPVAGNEGIEAAAAIFAELAETDPDIADQFRSDLLLMLGYALLARTEMDSALAVFAKAKEYAPAAAGPLLGMARARLHRANDPASAADATVEVSSELAEAQELALLARDRRRVWNGNSGESAAIAVQARAGSDPRGALRLALPAPRGVATDAEAQNPQLRQASAIAAIYAGEHLLAAELAAGITDAVERDLVRATALAEVPNVGDEVEQALRRALRAAPVSRPDQLVRALLGLVRLGAPILPDQPGTVAPELGRLRDTDAEAADMVEASAALRSGEPRQALVLARQYPNSVPAVEIAAEAAAATGDRKEAFRILDRAGRARHDDTLRTQAMFLAADVGLDEEAQQVATQLVLSRDGETRRRALEVQLTLADRAAKWEEVTELGRRLLDDNTLDLSDVRRGEHVAEYRWAVAGAEFNLRRPERARKALDEPDRLEPRTPSQALLLLTVLRATAAPPSQERTSAGTALGSALLERVLAVASAFPNDEDVVASALKLVMTSSGTEPLPDTLLTRVRDLQEEFFNRFPDSAHLRRISIGDDLSGLVEHLRATFEPGAEQIVELARQVWLGLYPQGLLGSVTGRSYAEMLIKRVVGCLVASAADPALADTEQTASRAARETGSVVIDTSALVLLDHLSGRAQRLTAQFARVLLPASHRDDILEARNSLALRSTGTLGWNAQQQRPQFAEVPLDVVEDWAQAGDRLGKRLALVEVVPNAKQGWSWDDSLLLASRERVALWADDLALRHAARSLGVPAFGTLDLVTDLVNAGQLPQSVLREVVGAFQRAYVVDLPLEDQLLDLAATEGWKPAGYAALLLARPRFWSQPANGFAQFMQLVRSLPPTERTPDTVAGWAAAAMTGLAWAIPPPTRPRAVAGLVAWTVLNAGDAEIFPKVLDAGESVMAAAAPASDLLAETVSALTDTLGSIVPANQVGILFTRLLANFDQQRRTQAMQSFLSMPR